MKKFVLSSLILAGLTTGAFAQSNFADVDADTNGELSFAELQVAWPDLSQAEFTTADADASGGLSTTELGSLQPSAAAPAPAEAPSAPTLAPTDAPESLVE